MAAPSPNSNNHEEWTSRPYKVRVKTGCLTCRIRRIKCDETKPSCQRCTSTGRKCDGYVPGPVPRRPSSTRTNSLKSSSLGLASPDSLTGKKKLAPLRPAGVGSSNGFSPDPTSLQPVPVLMTAAFGGSDEIRAFEYFTCRTIPNVTMFMGGDFWSSLPLQMCHSEPAVKHGLLALSAAHKMFEHKVRFRSKEVCEEETNFAMMQYAKAVSHSRTLLEMQQNNRSWVERILVSCAIFTCFENVMGNYKLGQMHLRNGLRILYQNVVKPQFREPSSQPPFHRVSQFLCRLDLQAMTLSDEDDPYEYVGPDMEPTPLPMPTWFVSVAEARDHLIANIRWLQYIGRSPIHNPDEQYPIKEPLVHLKLSEIRKNMQLWKVRFEALVRTLDPADITVGITFLKIYHTIVEITMEAAFSEDLTAFDMFTAEFEELVELLERLGNPADIPFSFDLGVIVPAFFTAMSCRHPVIRRRAASFLRSANRKEGVWESRLAVRMSERLIELEEAGLAEVRGPEDVPITSRIYQTGLSVLPERKYRATFYSKPDGFDVEGAEWHKVIDVFEL